MKLAKWTAIGRMTYGHHLCSKGKKGRTVGMAWDKLLGRHLTTHLSGKGVIQMAKVRHSSSNAVSSLG